MNRARAFMPPGTVPPFVMRFDAGSVPVGYLVFSSETRKLRRKDLQDAALFRVRPMFATLPGVSAPPPFGGSQRTIVVSVDPDRLRAYNMCPDEVVAGARARATRSARRATSASATRCRSCRSTPSSTDVKRSGRRPDPLRRNPHRLPPRRRDRRRRRRHRNSATRSSTAGARLHPGHQAGRRLDAHRRQPRQGEPAEVPGRAAAGHQGQLRVRPVALRHARDPRA